MLVEANNPKKGNEREAHPGAAETHIGNGLIIFGSRCRGDVHKSATDGLTVSTAI